LQRLLCGETERSAVPLKPGNAGGGKGPQFKTNATRSPLGTARLYSENIFLEYAQCRPEGKMTSLNDEDLQAAMQAGMRLHVHAYMVNARNYHNPIVRGATLFAIVEPAIFLNIRRRAPGFASGASGFGTLVSVFGSSVVMSQIRRHRFADLGGAPGRRPLPCTVSLTGPIPRPGLFSTKCYQSGTPPLSVGVQISVTMAAAALQRTK
jgi:hypothetical protein